MAGPFKFDAGANGHIAAVEPEKVQLISFLKPSQIIEYTPPDGSILVGDFHIVKGMPFVIGGAPGVGKSRSAVALAEAGATKRNWFGLDVRREFRTMILQNENGPYRLKLEISEIGSSMEDWVRISPPPPLGLCFDSSDFREQLKNLIGEFMPDVLIIDPWNASARKTGQEDYLDTFRLIQSTLPQDENKPALGIIAHTRKPKSDERHSGRSLLNLLAGSYVLGSVPRCVWVMQSASDDVEDQRVIWTCCKNNDGELGPRSAWVRQNGLFSPIKDFDWESFDSNGNGHKINGQNWLERIKEDLCGQVTRQQIIDWLVAHGVSEKSAYRWIKKSNDDGHLKGKDGCFSL